MPLGKGPGSDFPPPRFPPGAPVIPPGLGQTRNMPAPSHSKSTAWGAERVPQGPEAPAAKGGCGELLGQAGAGGTGQGGQAEGTVHTRRAGQRMRATPGTPCPHPAGTSGVLGVCPCSQGPLPAFCPPWVGGKCFPSCCRPAWHPLSASSLASAGHQIWGRKKTQPLSRNPGPKLSLPDPWQPRTGVLGLLHSTSSLLPGAFVTSLPTPKVPAWGPSGRHTTPPLQQGSSQRFKVLLERNS